MFLAHFNMANTPLPNIPLSSGYSRTNASPGTGPARLLRPRRPTRDYPGTNRPGKILLLRLFIQALAKNRCRPLYLHLTHLNARGLLRLIVTALGEEPRWGKDRLFGQILERVERTTPQPSSSSTKPTSSTRRTHRPATPPQFRPRRRTPAQDPPCWTGTLARLAHPCSPSRSRQPNLRKVSPPPTLPGTKPRPTSTTASDKRRHRKNHRTRSQKPHPRLRHRHPKTDQQHRHRLPYPRRRTKRQEESTNPSSTKP